MRLRNSSAVALTLTLLFAPIAALACEWQCAPDDVAIAQTSPDSTGACHRIEATPDGGDALSASLHDCGTHQTMANGPARLSANRFSADAPLASIPPRRVAQSLVLVSTAASPADDLAPPGPSSGSMTPLRV